MLDYQAEVDALQVVKEHDNIILFSLVCVLTYVTPLDVAVLTQYIYNHEVTHVLTTIYKHYIYIYIQIIHTYIRLEFIQ